jgi:voltage-gated potassium channel
VSQARSVQFGVAILLTTFVVGVFGYSIVEDMDLVDAIYFTVITLFTVGFAEPAGGLSDPGRVFTIFILIVGVGAALYTATIGLEVILESFAGGQRQERRWQKQVDTLSDHIVICGFGSVGRGVWDRLRADPRKIGVVVIERSSSPPASIEPERSSPACRVTPTTS